MGDAVRAVMPLSPDDPNSLGGAFTFWCKGYDAAGALRYESPVPERWAGYGISVSGEVG